MTKPNLTLHYPTDSTLHVGNFDLGHLLTDIQASGVRLQFLDSIRQNIRYIRSTFEHYASQDGKPMQVEHAFPTKSSYWQTTLQTVLEEGQHLEFSSAHDLEVLLGNPGMFAPYRSRLFICSGVKNTTYLDLILQTHKAGYRMMVVIDNVEELDHWIGLNQPISIGLRLSSRSVDMSIYWSKLGLSPAAIRELTGKLSASHLQLEMLQFYTDDGCQSLGFDLTFALALELYGELKPCFPSLTYLNIGGGLPSQVYRTRNVEYPEHVRYVISTVKTFCQTNRLDLPTLMTEYGQYTVGESGMQIYAVTHIKQQDEDTPWLFINNSLLNTMPSLSDNRHSIEIFPLITYGDRPEEPYHIAGNSCDARDSISSPVWLPEIRHGEEQYLVFTNTGAYQENLSGMGGLTHCMVTEPKLYTIPDIHATDSDSLHALFEPRVTLHSLGF